MKTNEVYKIINKVTNKVYIGITNQGSGTRYRHHWYEARSGEPSPIHKSMMKYGEENFTIEIIDFAETYEELKEKEKYWIKQYDSMNREKGYNLTEGGDGTFGRIHSEETKEKIRQKAIGRKLSEETKKRMSESRKGKTSEKKKKHVLSMIEMGKKKIIAEYEHVDEFGVILEVCKEFNSMKEAAEFFKIGVDTLRKYVYNDTYCKKAQAYFRFANKQLTEQSN